MREQQTCLSDQVQGNIGKRQILFQHRSMPAPFGQTLSEDQRVVGDAQEIVEVQGHLLGGEGRRVKGEECKGKMRWLVPPPFPLPPSPFTALPHMLSTSSGSL